MNKILKKQLYSYWPGLDGTGDEQNDELLGKLNMQVQLDFGETLEKLNIKPTEIFIQGNREIKLDNSAWQQLLQKLGFSKEEK